MDFPEVKKYISESDFFKVNGSGNFILGVLEEKNVFRNKPFGFFFSF